MGSRLRPRHDPDKLALQLLSEILSPDQRAQYTAYGYFEVTGAKRENGTASSGVTDER
jgi:hypothetical protein